MWVTLASLVINVRSFVVSRVSLQVPGTSYVTAAQADGAVSVLSLSVKTMKDVVPQRPVVL